MVQRLTIPHFKALIVGILILEHSTLTLALIPIKVFLADSMLLSIRKSWEIFQIKQKFNTIAAFVDSKNYQN